MKENSTQKVEKVVQAPVKQEKQANAMVESKPKTEDKKPKKQPKPLSIVTYKSQYPSRL